MTECIGFYHFAHSYVRGNWRSAATSSPIILAKSCHDMDILYWLTGSPASRVSSSGSRVWFRKENAPKGAAERCLDDCPHRTLCPFYAPRWYLGSNEGWPASVISEDRSLDARIEAIRTGPYGRCVYACDNDVADQQGVIISFENGVIATFTLSAFTQDIDRTIRLMGSAGEIYGDLKQGRIECTDFLTGSKRAIRVKAPENGHHGGDDALMYEVESVLRASDRRVKSRSDIAEALEGHLICFAAEQARLENRTVDMEVFRQSL
jgi:predicted dehydrogenase